MFRKLWTKQIAAATVMAVALSGCSFGAGTGDGQNEQSTLRVMFYDEGSFFEQYGMLFSALYPDVDIEVVSTQNMYTDEVTDYNEATMTFIEEKKPDIVMLSQEQYKTMAADGKLYELDSVMEKEKYDTEGLIPGLLDYMRELGGGKVYGLAPSFYSQVLFYNKALFDKYQIDYPTDKMSWNEVISLARRFPTEGEPNERVYGLKMGYNEELFDMAGMLASADGVNYVNASQKLMTIDSDAWKNAFQTALDAIESNVLYFESMSHGAMAEGQATTYEDYLLRDPFVSGRLAMAIGDSNYVNQIEQAAGNDRVKDKVVQDWDLVTAPVGMQNPDQSNMMQFHNLLAISADSPNKEAAWQFLQYVTGDEYARVKSKSNNYNGLPVRTQYIKDEEGRNYAAFYALKPSTFDSYKDFDKLPENFWMEFRTAASGELQKVKDGNLSLDEALQLLQVKGQQLLDKEEPPAGDGGNAGAENAASSGESSP
ncbi:ABC transporter substrate-binding protein [Paenibacillus arenilitoris]|uniref:Extracellular solute-binding protein n=1 Tax=Paenibacillus arenilitoris TaxID=2772299 RepID=A0A927CM13_9BACL|nr:extracellular solute-binding protein [Paenibacillus arenilitoris]MBD2868090.1 extracellular solute-binding protein [Paenibacillus arenilitoris]